MMLPTWFEQRAAEVRFAWRMIRKTPGASVVAVLSLALGIGANTAVFSFVDTLLIARLPVRSPQELYNVAREIQGRAAMSWNYPDYRAFRDGVRAFSGVAGASGSQPCGLQVPDGGTAGVAELAYVSMVSGNYFEVLGVEAALGHLLTSRDDQQIGAAPYAVLSHDYWRRRFASDPAVIGRVVRLNAYPLTVVGVARAGFRGVDVATAPNLFVPMTMRSEVFGVPAGIWNSRRYWWFQVIGRLAPGATPARAVTELTTTLRAQEEAERRASPGRGLANAGQRVLLRSAARGHSSVRNTLATPLVVLTVVVGLVLLIACANVAGLLLSRAAARQREIAVRLAVGAGRARLAGQLLTESTVLSLIGGVAGLAVAYGCVWVMLGFVPQYGQQVALSVSPNLRLLGFSLAVSLATGMLFGLAPALQFTRPDLVGALKASAPTHGGRTRAWAGRALVVAQVALSLVLLVGAGLFVRTLRNLGTVELGLQPARTLLADIDPTRNGYEGQRLREFYDRLRSDVARLPGVGAVSLAAITPLSGSNWDEDLSAEGYTPPAGSRAPVNVNAVSSRYFETLGIQLLQGRDFRDEDNPAVLPAPPQTMERPENVREPEGPRVAIVTDSLARRFFGSRSAVGLRVSFGDTYDPAKAYEIVGVVADVHYEALRVRPEEMVYVPTWRRGFGSKMLCVRTVTESPALVEALRRATSSIDPAVPVLSARTMQQEIDNDVVVERLVTTLSTFFGGLALLLAAIGLYGVMAQSVARRGREIGIRVALGAGRGAVLWMVLRGAVLLVAGGAIIGVSAALAATRAIGAFLFGVTAQDPATIALGIFVLAAVAAVAAIIPARRATGVEPTIALRCE